MKHALELLDSTYFGNEHALYEHIFNKYIDDKSELLKKSEFVPLRYSTPLISEVLLVDNELIECSECLNSFPSNQFPADEFRNGYMLACAACSPDRNNVKSLKWHKQFKSASVMLENNGYTAKVNQSAHKYVVTDMRPMLKGVHCFRYFTKNHSTWHLWGISNLKKYTDNSYGNAGVYGIAGSNQSYRNGACGYDVQTNVFFGGKKEVMIDMLLDLNKGMLCFKIPGSESEAKMLNIPKSADGYVCHCNIHYANASVQIKKIPTSWYGQMAKRVKF